MSWDYHIPQTDFECATLLAELRWPNGFRCKCGFKGFYRLHSRPRVFECKLCGSQTSVTANTLLHRSRVPLQIWFLAAVLMMRPEGLSAAELKRRTNVHYETAWQILHRLRAGLSEERLRMRSPIQAAKRWARLQGESIKPNRRRDFTRLGTALYVIVDQGGKAAATFHNYQSYAFQRLVQRAAPEQTPPKPSKKGPAVELARRLIQRLHLTHHTVSRRWLPAYLLEFCSGVASAVESPMILLGGALKAEAARFVDLASERWCP
jgi:hypothetical protein